MNITMRELTPSSRPRLHENLCPGFIDGLGVSDRGVLQAADELRAQVFVFNFLQQLAGVS